MDIFKTFYDVSDDGLGCMYYRKVIFKDDFLIMLKRLIDETNDGKLNLLQKETTSDEVIDLIKKSQYQQLSGTSQCDVYMYDNCIYIHIYKDVLLDENDEIISKSEVISIHFNLINPNLPFIYLDTH